MLPQLQHKNSIDCNKTRLPAPFIAICTLLFVACLPATAYFCNSMQGEMKMPGGWTMSMMWMRMPGETWFSSALGFLLMWLAMMVVMMMPSAVPMFLKTKRHWRSLCYMASGYFTVWLIAGFGTYLLAIKFNDAAMRYEFLSRAVPLLSGALLIVTGAFQFTSWKMTQLLRCRSPFGCSASCPQDKTGFQLGCKQGLACCACCAALMTAQLILGIMNPPVMVVVTIFITAEKLIPRPEVTARLAGITAIIAGIIMTAHSAMLNYS